MTGDGWRITDGLVDGLRVGEWRPGDAPVVLTAVLQTTATRYLAPIRLFGLDGDDEAIELDGLLVKLAGQTRNLHRKLMALDRLALSEVPFSSEFGAARVAVICHDPHLDGSVLKQLVPDGLTALSELIGREVVAQLDYDLRRKHPHIGTELDTIDFEIQHDPTAIGTATSFEAVLGTFGGSIPRRRAAVLGVGDLGRRIVEALVRAGSELVLVHDLDEERAAAVADGRKVVAVPSDELDAAEVDQYVMSADTGSLNDARVRALAGNDRLVVVGGPEAGLDHSPRALDRLAEAGKQFVPSVLCGAMGLVSNLEESLGRRPNLAAQQERLAAVVRRLAGRSRATGLPFHRVCLAHLRGEVLPARA